jgi:hypothetical protein
MDFRLWPKAEISEIVISFIDVTERKLMEIGDEIKERSESGKQS